MLKTALFTLYSLFFLTTPLHAQHSSESIQWLKSYQEAVTESEKSEKPILVLFTGTDWCGWCKKLEREVFYTKEFSEVAGEKFVFLLLDFPMYQKQPTQQKEQNEKLKKQFGVRGFPTVVLLDEKQQKITSTGYQTGGGRKYGEYLIKVLSDYSSYQHNQSRASAGNATPEELEKLYKEAKQLGQLDDVKKIITLGMNSTKPSFFLLERYLHLVEEGLIHTEKAKLIKQRILSLDPRNEHGSHRRIAVIEYSHLAEEMEVSDEMDAWLVCKPLLDYIKRWGREDKDHLWRLQMTISQTLLNRELVDDAISYAKKSQTAAPLTMQPTIEGAIAEMEQIQQVMNRLSTQ